MSQNYQKADRAEPVRVLFLSLFLGFLQFGSYLLADTREAGLGEPGEGALEEFLDGGLDTEAMASTVDPALYRNRNQ